MIRSNNERLLFRKWLINRSVRIKKFGKLVKIFIENHWIVIRRGTSKEQIFQLAKIETHRWINECFSGIFRNGIPCYACVSAHIWPPQWRNQKITVGQNFLPWTLWANHVLFRVQPEDFRVWPAGCFAWKYNRFANWCEYRWIEGQNAHFLRTTWYGAAAIQTEHITVVVVLIDGRCFDGCLAARSSNTAELTFANYGPIDDQTWNGTCTWCWITFSDGVRFKVQLLWKNKVKLGNVEMINQNHKKLSIYKEIRRIKLTEMCWGYLHYRLTCRRAPNVYLVVVIQSRRIPIQPYCQRVDESW